MAALREFVFSLSETYVFLEDGGGAPRIAISDAFWKDLMSGAPRSPEARLVAGGDGWLAALYSITHDGAWEMHPRGQELLVMISGTMDVVFEIDGREESHTLPAGQALIVPQGIWHRQRVRTAGSFLAATYGKGTQHRLL